MQYMLIFNQTQTESDFHDDPARFGPYMGAWMNYIDAVKQAGALVNGDGLMPPRTASIVRVRDGKRTVQDGPYPDSKEQLGGYVIINVAGLDEALDWAARSPAAAYASVEVRPVMMPPGK